MTDTQTTSKVKERVINMTTKKDFEDLIFNILNPLKDKYSKGYAMLELGSTAASYPMHVVKMESFARPLWGLVPFWRGGGDNEDFEKIYLEGIISGTNPEGDEYWGDCRDYDQRFVEMASLAYGLIFSPDKLWYPLTDKQKSNFSKWLYQINNLYVHESNWLFFRILVNVALKKCGMEYSKEKLSKDLDVIEKFYIGDGWYSDGIEKEGKPDSAQKDYYVSFAIHFYGLIYAMAMEVDDKDRSEKFKKRAYEFAQDFIYWFADSGEAVPYGRSLTYRFAQIAFWSMCLVANVLPFEVGVIKGIILRNLEYWLSDDRIFDNGHILTIGYRYNQLTMSEGYNAPGSPYWCMKAFAFMMLSEEHIFWKVDALPLPELEQISIQKKPEIMLGRYNGAVTLYPAGTLNSFPNEMMHKYLKFTYSTMFGFSVPRSNWHFESATPDGTLAFEIDERVYTRVRNRGFEILEDKIIIDWSPGFGIEVKTELIPTTTGHIRKHHIESVIDCVAYDSGYAVDARGKLNKKSDQGFATAWNDKSYCSVYSESGLAEVKVVAANTNLISPKTVIPTIVYKIKTGVNELVTEIREIV